MNVDGIEGEPGAAKTQSMFSVVNSPAAGAYLLDIDLVGRKLFQQPASDARLRRRRWWKRCRRR